MKRGLPYFASLAAVIGCALVSPNGVKAQKTEPITISPSDFNIPKTEALERLEELEAMAVVSVSTADYARLFRQFQDDLGKVRPQVSQWTDSEQERVENLKQPSEAAWSALQLEEQNAQARLERQGREAQQNYATRQEMAREQQRLNQQQEFADQQARLRDAQIRESEARTEYYEDWDDWYSPWWFSGGHGYPHHRKRRPLYDPTKPLRKPMVPNNYKPQPVPRR